MTRGIGRIVQRLFIGYHIGIVRMAGKVQGQSRPFVLRKFRQIAVWQILPTCIFTDIVGIIEANYKKEGPGVFPFKKGNGSLSQSVVGVRMKDRKPNSRSGMEAVCTCHFPAYAHSYPACCIRTPKVVARKESGIGTLFLARPISWDVCPVNMDALEGPLKGAEQ